MLYVVLLKILMFYCVCICYIKRIATILEVILLVPESKSGKVRDAIFKLSVCWCPGTMKNGVLWTSVIR